MIAISVPPVHLPKRRISLLFKPWAHATTSAYKRSHAYVHYAIILTAPNSGLQLGEPSNRANQGISEDCWTIGYRGQVSRVVVARFATYGVVFGGELHVNTCYHR